ncbi:hypothetical protein HDV05_002784, partial [Chytridiales sp. JEL 0842]
REPSGEDWPTSNERTARIGAGSMVPENAQGEVEEGEFIMAPPNNGTARRGMQPPVAAVTTRSKHQNLYFPLELEKEGKKKVASEVDVNEWMFEHDITSQYKVKKTTWKKKRVWVIQVSNEMLTKAQAAAAMPTGSNTYSPMWDAEEETTETPAMMGEYEGYVMLGIAP